MAKTRVAVIFGSRSVEHEVSIVTAHQIMEALDRQQYDVIPVYITKQGQWYTGEALRQLDAFKNLDLAALDPVILPPQPGTRALTVTRPRGLWRSRPAIEVDVAFPALHGTFGEDGTLQGLLELADLPYVGAGVVGSAVGMDKIIMKAVFRACGLPVVHYIPFLRQAWRDRPAAVLAQVEESLGYPVFVKPANLGSSVGISKAKTADELRFALDVACHYDRRLIVEASAEGAVEINCSVLGNDAPVASVCEQPVAWRDFLSYEDKYLRGGQAKGLAGAQRRIPAPISPELTARIQALAVDAFRAVDCRGIARVDFLAFPDGDEVFVNEINTLPGSFSLYLWEPSGLSPAALVDRLIQLAFEAHEEKQRTTYAYDSNLLQQVKLGGAKK